MSEKISENKKKDSQKEKYKFTISLDVRDFQGFLRFIEENSEYLNNQSTLKSSVNTILNKMKDKINSEATEKDKTAIYTKERINDILNNRKRCPICGNYREELFELNKGEERRFKLIGCDKCLQKMVKDWTNSSKHTISRTHCNYFRGNCREIVKKNYDEIPEIWDLIKSYGIKIVEELISNLDFASMNHPSKYSRLTYYATKKGYFEYQRNTIEESLLNENVMKFFLNHEKDVKKTLFNLFNNRSELLSLHNDYRKICEKLISRESKITKEIGMIP